MEDNVMNWNILKDECNNCENILTDGSNLDHHVNERCQDDWNEKPVQSARTNEQQIKVERLQTENDQCYQQEEQLEFYVDGTVKIEETVLNWPISKYECDICFDIFTDRSSLDHHVTEHHQYHSNDEPVRSLASKEEQIKVEELQTENDQDEQLDSMRNDTTHNDLMPSKCKQTESLKSKYELENDERPFRCKQPGCKKSFKTNKVLKLHVIVHSEETPFKCDQFGCTKSFKRKKDMLRHRMVHSDEKPFKCEEAECRQSFKWKQDLKKHMDVHTNEKPFKCEQNGCTKAFRRKKDLVRHITIHNVEKPFKCDQPVCTKSFKSKLDLHNHKKRVHSNGKPFMCNECRRSFKTKQHLTQHMIVHRNTRPVNARRTKANGLLD